MRKPALLSFCVALIASLPTLSREMPTDARIKVIKFGKLVTGTGQIIKNARVVVEDDKITSVSQGESEIPKSAQVIDLGRFTGIPGLIDAHTHMTYYWDGKPGSDPWRQGGQRMPAVTVFLAQENARKTLETGVTTESDIGGPRLKRQTRADGRSKSGLRSRQDGASALSIEPVNCVCHRRGNSSQRLVGGAHWRQCIYH